MLRIIYKLIIGIVYNNILCSKFVMANHLIHLICVRNYRIVVLDNGCIVEYDTPSKLLGDEKSLFYSMAKDANLLVQH